MSYSFTIITLFTLTAIALCAGQLGDSDVSIGQNNELNRAAPTYIGTVGPKKFYIDDQWMNYTSAKSYCESFGYEMFTINSFAEQEFLKNHNSVTGFGYWLAAKNIQTREEFRWEDGSILSSYDNQFATNGLTSELCLYFLGSPTYQGTWAMVPCKGFNYKALCQSK